MTILRSSPVTRRIPVVCILLSVLAGMTAAAAFRESYDVEEAFGYALIDKRLYDYARDQVKYLRQTYVQNAAAINILEARLFAETGERTKALKTLDKVPKDSPDYTKALLVKASLSADPKEQIQALEQYLSTAPKPTEDGVAASQYKRYVMKLSGLQLAEGQTQAAKKTLDRMQGIGGTNDEQTQRQIWLMSGRILLAGADQLRQAGKPEKEYVPLVKQGLEELKQLIWKPDYFASLAYPDICHAHNLLGEPDEAIRTFEMAVDVLKQTEEEVRNQVGSVAASPMAPAIFYLAESYMEKGRQAREKEKKTSDPAEKAKFQDEAAKYLINAAKCYFRVYGDYKESSKAQEALGELNKVIQILDRFYGVHIEPPNSQEIDVALSTGKEMYAQQRFASAAESYLKAIGLNPSGSHVLDAAYFATASFYKTGQFWKAMAINDFMIDRFPSSEKTGQSTYNIGVALHQEARRIEGGDPAEADKLKELATDYLAMFVELAPTSPFAADTAYRIAEQQFARANELRKESKELEARNASVEQINAKVEQAKKAFLKAAPMYQSVVDNHPASVNAVKAYRKLGWVYQILERREEAARNFLAYCDAENENLQDKVEAKFMAADNFMRAGDPDSSIENFKELIEWTAKDGKIPDGPKAKMYRTRAEELLPWAYDLKAQQLATRLREQRELLAELEAQPAEKPPAEPAKKEEVKEPEAGEGEVVPEDTALRPEDVKARIAQLEKELAQFRDLALKGLIARVKANPRSDDTPANMAKIGAIYGQMEDFDNAAEWLGRLDREYPQTPAGQQALFTLFRSYLNINATAKARDVAKRMVDRLTDYGLPNVLFIATQMFETNERMEQSVIDPDLALAANRELIKRAEKARPGSEDYDTLVRAKLRAEFLEAKVLLLMGKHQEALEKAQAFNQNNAKNPYFFDAMILIGKAAREKGDMELAMRTFDELLNSVDQQAYPVTLLEATVESARTLNASSQIGRVKQAVARLRPVVDFIDPNPEVPEELAWLEAAYAALTHSYAYLGELDKAQEYQNKYLDLYQRKIFKGAYRKDILALPAPKF